MTRRRLTPQVLWGCNRCGKTKSAKIKSKPTCSMCGLRMSPVPQLR